MDTSRFLIIGAYGQLGKALHAQYPKAQAVDRDELDITNQKSLDGFDWTKIDVILNAAAYTNVDGAETEGRALAWQINATAVGALSAIATQHKIIFVHISSDYVFDGTKNPHTETEPFTPIGAYGQSKAAGDIAVATNPQHYILRTSWLIGDGPNFIRTMIGLANKNVSPKVVNDQVGRLTFTSTLVEAIAHLLKTKVPYGTYNLSNDGVSASWADIAQAVFKELGREDLKVIKTTTKAYLGDKTDISPRPLQSVLSLDKIKTTGLALGDWRKELHTYITNEQAKK